MPRTLKDLLVLTLSQHGKTWSDIRYIMLQSHAYDHAWKWTADTVVLALITASVGVNQSINTSTIIVGDEWWIEFESGSPLSIRYKTFPHLQPEHGLPQIIMTSDLLHGY